MVLTVEALLTISVTTSRKPWMGLKIKALAFKINDWNGTHYIYKLRIESSSCVAFY